MPRSERLLFLDSLRAVAVVLVVGVHTLSYLDAMRLPGAPLLAFLLAAIAVPSFVLADGFLFARRMAEIGSYSYRVHLARSARRLLLPWLVFTVVYSGLRVVAEGGGWVTTRIFVGRTAAQIGLALYSSAAAQQLYFLLSLFLIRAACGWLRRLATGSAIGALTAWAIYTIAWRVWLEAAYLSVLDLPGSDPLLGALAGLQYYLLGIALYRAWTLWGGRALLLAGGSLAMMAGVLAWRPEQTGVAQYAYLLGAFWIAFRVTRKPGVVVRAGTVTMGIYVLHAPLVLRLVQLAVSPLALGVVADFALIWIATVFGTALLAWSVGRTAIGRALLGPLPAPRTAE